MQIGRIIRSYTVEPLVEPLGQSRPATAPEPPKATPTLQPDPLRVERVLVPRDAR